MEDDREPSVTRRYRRKSLLSSRKRANRRTNGKKRDKRKEREKKARCSYDREPFRGRPTKKKKKEKKEKKEKTPLELRSLLNIL